jgi:CubicO group peptidase (beta-lactamase class C family)
MVVLILSAILGVPLGQRLQAETPIATTVAMSRLPISTPESASMRSQRLADVEPLVKQGIAAGQLPGAVICVGRHGKVVYLRAFGERQIVDDHLPMTTDTVFDMASVTKPVATATSIMKLVETDQLRLNDKVAKYFPEFSPHGKDSITIQHLLLHQSGLIPDNALSDYQDGPEKAWERICNLKLIAPVGKTFKYSDVNFITLAYLIEKLSGKSIADFSHDEIFAPLGMQETGYNPAAELKQRAAPTEKRGGQWMRGQVHDPRAFALSGVAGHAGLFSTAEDMAVYAQMMLGQGSFEFDGKQTRILAPETVHLMTSSYPVSSGRRGLGWDIQSPYSSNRGNELSMRAYGHGGFTGTVLWIDPDLELFFIFLSNRVHPNGQGSVNQLAGRILDIVATSIIDESR